MKKILLTIIVIIFVFFLGSVLYKYAYPLKNTAKNFVHQNEKKIAWVTATQEKKATPPSQMSITPTILQHTEQATNAITPSQSTNSCNNLLVLVDRQHALSSSYTPPDLINLQANGIPTTTNELLARKLILPDLQNLFKDATSANIVLTVVSPYRSYATQSSVYNSYVKQYGAASANQFSAMPGESQHQLGTAIDFSTTDLHDQLDQSFDSTKAGAWLLSNAYKYGFYISYPKGSESITGYEYEPWHFRYLGISTSTSLHNTNTIMQTFLEKNGVIPNC